MSSTIEFATADWINCEFRLGIENALFQQHNEYVQVIHSHSLFQTELKRCVKMFRKRYIEHAKRSTHAWFSIFGFGDTVTPNRDRNNRQTVFAAHVMLKEIFIGLLKVIQVW